MGGDAAWWWMAALGAVALASLLGDLRRQLAPGRRRGFPAAGGERDPWPLVVLVRDAAPFIEGLVEDLAAVTAGAAMVVVDCGSTDETLAILRRMRQRVPTLHVLHWPSSGRRRDHPGPLEAALFMTGSPLAVTVDLTGPARQRWQELRSPLLRLLDPTTPSRKYMTG